MNKKKIIALTRGVLIMSLTASTSILAVHNYKLNSYNEQLKLETSTQSDKMTDIEKKIEDINKELKDTQIKNDELQKENKKKDEIIKNSNEPVWNPQVLSESLSKDFNINMKDMKLSRGSDIDKIINGGLPTLHLNYNPDDVTELSYINVYGMKKALEGTSLEPLARYYVEAERKFGVNALFLAGITAHESSWGNSQRAEEQNNLTGFAVYSDSSSGATFDSKRNNIIKTAELLKKNYLTNGANYFKGKSIYDVNQSYCFAKDGSPDMKWSDSINSIANDLKTKALS